MGGFGERVERRAKWATVWGAIIAALALGTTVVFSWLTLSAANTALKESRSQAWGVQGAANCHNYREEVLTLVKEHVPEREIRAWFAAENGEIDNPFVKGTSRTALDDYETGCAHLNLLLAVLDPKAAPSADMLARDGVPQADVSG